MPSSRVSQPARAKAASASRSLPAGAAPSQAAPEPDLAAALDRVIALMAIPGVSGAEGAVARFVTQQLVDAGADPAAIRFDDANKRTILPGEVGNLVFQLPGTKPGPRRLLMAHLDTVPICVGSDPKRRGDVIYSANPRSGLGADDRGGVATILTAAIEILTRKLDHPPLTFFWPVQEEVGLHGARHADLRMLGRPKLAFNWDGGPAEKLTLGATGGYRLSITITGLASHAGNAPERGVSAIAIAGLAIADLVENGWHGDIQRGRKRGTSNIGVIHGGDATNVVTHRVEIKAEARSHDPKFRAQIVRAIERAFQKAVKSVRSSDGKRGAVQFDGRLDYESFRLADDEPAVLAAEAALRAIGAEPYRAISNGGLDANWMSVHGIPTVTLGCGQSQVHTTSEQLEIGPFEQACRLALRLATGA